MAAMLHLGAKGILPGEIVWEILKWLPTKSLMRFKAVSKLWLSIILDPNFAREHRSPFRGGLLMNPDPSPELGGRRQPTRSFITVNPDDAFGSESSKDANDVNISFQFSIPEDIHRFHASNMVNGIICFYNRNVAKLCNIATREIIDLPESRCDYEYCNYHLGFDPVQSVFKLLKICPIYEKMECTDRFLMECHLKIQSIECEILTLGVDSSWRSINPPPNRLIPHALCIDGVLYWMTEVRQWDECNNQLFSFHLAGEKFQSIHEPFEFGDIIGGKKICLFPFETSLALAECYLLSPLSLFCHRNIMITQYHEGSWTEMKNHNIDQDISFMVVPDGYLMMYSNHGGFTKVYLFDQTRKHIRKLTLRVPAKYIRLLGRFCWYEENIISLKRLMGF